MTLTEALEEMDFDTADDLAEFLEAKKIKGYPLDPTTCPVSNWLYMATGQIVQISPFYARTTDRGSIQRHLLPDAATDLVIDFDCGLYPELAY